jgi:hypothetical protein
MSSSIFKHLSLAVSLVLASVVSTPVLSQPAEATLSSGSVIGKHIFGLARDFQGDPVMIDDDPLIYASSATEFDVDVAESTFRVSLFDHTIAGAYVTALDRESKAFVNTVSLPLGNIGGAHTIGASLKSAWNSVLFSEAALLNAKGTESIEASMKPYFKHKPELVKPYNYGWLNEVIVLDEKGAAKAIKNYAAGRTFASHILAMPDAKTFYLFDSEHSGNVYLFIAEEANSLVKGTLYAISQAENLKAIELGKSSALKMKFKLKRAGFNAFFAMAEPEQGQCPASYELVSSVYGEECLKVQKKNRKYVGQFEPIRMAVMKGVKPLVKGAEEILLDSHNSVINVKHNGGETRQYKLGANAELGTQYFMTN